MLEMNDRLMLYIDILGFSDFMKKTPPNILKQKLCSYENIFKAYNKGESFKEVEQTDPMVKRMFPNVTTYEDNPESSVFSDSILFSYKEYMPEEFLNDTPVHFKEANCYFHT